MSECQKLITECRIVIVGLLPFALYGFYRFAKWIGKMDRKNVMTFDKKEVQNGTSRR